MCSTLSSTGDVTVLPSNVIVWLEYNSSCSYSQLSYAPYITHETHGHPQRHLESFALSDRRLGVWHTSTQLPRAPAAGLHVGSYGFQMKVTTKGLEELGKGQIKDSHLTGSGLANGTLLPLSITLCFLKLGTLCKSIFKLCPTLCEAISPVLVQK